jgi:hypothetical protein
MDVRRAIRRVPLGAWVGGLAVAAALGVAAGADASPMPEPPAPPPPARRAWPAAIPAPAPDGLVDAGVPGYAGGGRAASNARGDMALAWTDAGGVWASVRPAGEAWGARHLLSIPGEAGADVAGVAVEGNGDAVVLWTASADARAPQARAIVRSADLRAGAWRPAQTLFTGPSAGEIPFSGSVYGTFLAGTPDGRAIAVWTVSGQGAVWSERRPGGAWSPAAAVPGAPPWVRALAVDATGNAVIAADDSWVGEGRLVVQEHAAGGTWGAPIPLGPSAEARFGDLVVAPGGAAVVAWRDRLGGAFLAERPAGGTWGPPAPLSHGSEPELALGPDGELLAAWNAFDLDDPTAPFVPMMQVRSRAPDGVWGPTQTLSAPCWAALRSEATIDAHGDAVVMWFANDNATGRMVQFAARPAGGAWSASRTLETSPWEPITLTPGAHGDLLLIRGGSPWGPLPALTLPHDRWIAPAGEGLACVPAPDAERRDGTTTPVEVIQDPGPGGRETDEQSLLATSSPAVAPTARTLRLVRSGRRAVVAFTLGTPFRVRATVHRAGRRVARLAERRMAAGRRAMGLGALPPGRYRVVMELRGADGSARITRTLRLKAVPRRR